VVLVSVVIIGALVWPQGIGGERTLVLAQAVALRGVLLVGLALAAVVCGFTALRMRRSRRRTALAAMTAALVLASVLDIAVISSRGVDTAELGPVTGDEIRILSWNTEHAAPGVEAIADYVVEQSADIVVLPETDSAATEEIASRIEATGRPVYFDTIEQDFPGSTPTSLLVTGDLSAVGYRRSSRAGSTPGQPSGLWEPTDATAPVIGAVHTVPPMPWAMALWSSGLDWAADNCTDPRVVMAGDFNATLDHFSGLGVDGGAVGRCRDAPGELSAASRGTWPSDFPELLASPIDHVLVGSSWRISAFDVLDAAGARGSDHRPILAVLRPAA
jgi:endonuclease/exonuclease/phosphatase (EEP) superfamily protein YafD